MDVWLSKPDHEDMKNVISVGITLLDKNKIIEYNIYIYNM